MRRRVKKFLRRWAKRLEKQAFYLRIEFLRTANPAAFVTSIILVVLACGLAALADVI